MATATIERHQKALGTAAQHLQLARVLVINPNTSVSLTKSFEPILASLDLPHTTITYWTCPKGPAIIKTLSDMHESAAHCLPLLLAIADRFDGFLLAGYGDHPLVNLMQAHFGGKPVVGILEGSVFAALQLASGPRAKFGIVTTGVAYEDMLCEAVRLVLGADEQQLARFAGVCASGIGLADLQPEARVGARNKIMAATSRLIQASGGDIAVVNMGGVILAGMESWVHEACEQELGVERGRSIKVVDQIVAGMLTLDAILRRTPLQVVDFRRALK